jgi:glycogen(starch) synthase
MRRDTKEAQLDKLQILFVARQYPPNMAWGGIGSYVFSMARALAARGHEVHVLSCAEGQKERDYMDQGVFVHRRAGRIPARRLWIRMKRLMNGILRIPSTLWRFEKGLEVFFECRLLGIDFDVIEYPDWGALGCMLALMRTRPLVAFIHTPPPSAYHIQMNRDMRWAWSLVFYSSRRADITTVSSLFHVRALQTDGLVLGKHVAIVPNGIDCARWGSTQTVSSTRPVALFVGRLEEIKAPEVLVAAMAIVRKEIPEATAVFVGRSGERDGLPYNDWIKSTAGDTSGCAFIGYVPQHEIMSYLSLSRVLALPSVFDVYPIAVLEAMAAGRPVVITKTCGIAEQIESTGGGKAVPPGDPEALAGALLPFLADPQYAATVGEKAQSAVRERNDIWKVAAEREKVYLQAIRRFHNSGG